MAMVSKILKTDESKLVDKDLLNEPPNFINGIFVIDSFQTQMADIIWTANDG